MYKKHKKTQIIFTLTTLLITTVLSGCSLAIKHGAQTGLAFSEKHILPPVLTMNDVDMVCTHSNSITPLIMATKDMGADPARMAVMLYASAGMCAESKALNAELRYIRAAKAGQVSEAQDARIEQKRWAAIAAERQYTGYQLFADHWEHKYNYKLGEECLNFQKDKDQTIYVLALISGLQSMTNDINSGGQVHVPKDIAAKVERGMRCVDNDTYWGVPKATRAVIWTLLPGSGVGKPDPFMTLQQSMQIGEAKGVRLSHALNAVAAQASGDDVKIRNALRAYAASRAEGKPVNPQYRLLDQMAGQMIQSIADRYWTEHTGVRAGEDGMSQFWDDKKTVGDDALFGVASAEGH